MCDPDDMQRRHVTDDHTVVFSHLNLRQYAALLYREQVKGEHHQTFRELSPRLALFPALVSRGIHS